MTNNWVYSKLTDEEIILKDKLAAQLSIDDVLATLLVKREVYTFDQAKEFFRPELSHLHNPYEMKDMDRAVERLTKAMKNNEKILIYGDYDVDGTTSVALVYRFLIDIYSNLDFYIPDRYTEGYGVSFNGIDYASKSGVGLIISLDCGIKATEKVEYAKSLGIDFIICDHHNPDENIPKAVAVLDPKRKDCNYPYKHLSGCGVGYKLLQAFCERNEIEQQKLLPHLDLVALSIASDIVPITGENRVLMYFGLEQLNREPSVGVAAILEVCNLKNRELTVSDIVFKIGPRINASGRINTAKETVELLVSKDLISARQKSHTIDSYNNERKLLDKNITDEAISMINHDTESTKRDSIVICKKGWHKGVVGIVASRLVEEFYKPTIVLTLNNGLASGSARSVDGFDIYKAIDSCKNLLENFGGHMYAAGLTIKEENVEKFVEEFEKYVSNNIEDYQKTPQIEIDSLIKLNNINDKFCRILEQFNPFGPGNMKPIFVSENVFDSCGKSKLVGKDKNHLRIEVSDSPIFSKEDNLMVGIAFNMEQFYKPLKSREPINICYTIEKNQFKGQISKQLMIKDIKTENINQQ